MQISDLSRSFCSSQLHLSVQESTTVRRKARMPDLSDDDSVCCPNPNDAMMADSGPVGSLSRAWVLVFGDDDSSTETVPLPTVRTCLEILQVNQSTWEYFARIKMIDACTCHQMWYTNPDVQLYLSARWRDKMREAHPDRGGSPSVAAERIHTLKEANDMMMELFSRQAEHRQLEWERENGVIDLLSSDHSNDSDISIVSISDSGSNDDGCDGGTSD